VFGEETGSASIVPALREWAKTSKADVDAMLERVHELLPPPSLAGLEPRRKQRASDLYSRGFYDAALAVALPGETS
jgi:hypothetical protein